MVSSGMTVVEAMEIKKNVIPMHHIVMNLTHVVELMIDVVLIEEMDQAQDVILLS